MGITNDAPSVSYTQSSSTFLVNDSNVLCYTGSAGIEDTMLGSGCAGASRSPSPPLIVPVHIGDSGATLALSGAAEVSS